MYIIMIIFLHEWHEWQANIKFKLKFRSEINVKQNNEIIDSDGINSRSIFL